MKHPNEKYVADTLRGVLEANVKVNALSKKQVYRHIGADGYRNIGNLQIPPSVGSRRGGIGLLRVN